MDTGTVTIIVSIIGLAGTYITVRYKDYWKNKPKKKTTMELFFERYEDDIKDLRKRVKEAEDNADEARKQAQEALRLVKEKDEEINKLQRQISLEKAKYTRLLRRFNVLKAKVDKQQKEK